MGSIVRYCLPRYISKTSLEGLRLQLVLPPVPLPAEEDTGEGTPPEAEVLEIVKRGVGAG